MSKSLDIKDYIVVVIHSDETQGRDVGYSFEEGLYSLKVDFKHILILTDNDASPELNVARQLGLPLAVYRPNSAQSEICELAFDFAVSKGMKFFVIVSPIVLCRNDVVARLIGMMRNDPKLAACAPSQMIVDITSGKRRFARRMRWNLEELSFGPDFGPQKATERLEADYCDTVCTAFLTSAVQAVGGFDNRFGAHLADADICYRLREGGFSVAYAVGAFIDFFVDGQDAQGATSLVGNIERSKNLFFLKHLGVGISGPDIIDDELTPLRHLRLLPAALRQNALLQAGRPRLICSIPGVAPFDYLYMPYSLNLRQEWKDILKKYRAVLLSSASRVKSFVSGGVANAHYVPIGIDPDIFSPWGSHKRFSEDTTFLWFGSKEHQSNLELVLAAWESFSSQHPRSHLVVVCQGVLDEAEFSDSFCCGNSFRLEHRSRRVTLLDPVAPFADEELAELYRSVDFFIGAPLDDGLSPNIVHAMACGTPPLFPLNVGMEFDVSSSDALLFGVRSMSADLEGDALDDGQAGGGGPNFNEIVSRMARAVELGQSDIQRHRVSMGSLVRNKLTWRNTCFALKKAIAETQARSEWRSTGSDEHFSGYHQYQTALDAEDSALPGRPGALIPEFNEQFYLRMNPDVSSAGIDPETHFLQYGWLEGRDPIPGVSVGQLLLANAGARRLLLEKAEEFRKTQQGPSRPLPRSRSHAIGHAPKNAVLFVGYVEAGLGLGESLRGLIRAADHAGLDFSIYPHNVRVENRFIGRFHEERYDLVGCYAVNVFEMAVDELPAALAALGRARTENSYNILRTYWELPQAPERWEKILEAVDEVWVPSSFVAAAIEPIFHGPITRIPPFVDILSDPPAGIPRDDSFRFMFSFDFWSYPSRKNPLGVIEAFRSTFKQREHCSLLLKSVGPSMRFPLTVEKIEDAVSDDGRIMFMRDPIPRAAMLGLLSASDSYVSLHRSEGFGLGMAEAMAYGKAAIGTNFSGNTDFLSVDTGFPVGFKRRALLDGEYVESRDQYWAEPDLHDACKAMRSVFEDDAEVQKRRRGGQKFIQEKYGLATVSQLLQARLLAIDPSLGNVRARHRALSRWFRKGK